MSPVLCVVIRELRKSQHHPRGTPRYVLSPSVSTEIGIRDDGRPVGIRVGKEVEECKRYRKRFRFRFGGVQRKSGRTKGTGKVNGQRGPEGGVESNEGLGTDRRG